jgi:hypothetical protein
MQPYETLARLYWILDDMKTAKYYTHLALNILEDYGFLDPRDRARDFEKMLKSLTNPQG